MAGEWCLIESDPGVFTSLINEFGVSGIEVEELCSLDAESFAHLKPVHGLIFLFKYVEDQNPSGTAIDREDVFFAKQVINNACATQAIVNLLLNVEHADVKLGKTLSEFKEFTGSFDSQMKGLALSNSDVIKKVHNSFSRQQIFEFDNTTKPKDEDLFHFIGYMPVHGRLFELDGLKPGPIDLGKIEGSDWLDTVRPVIQARMQKYSAGEIHFNLMAIVSDQRVKFENQISILSATPDFSQNQAAQNEVNHLKAMIQEQDIKRQKYRLENVRRKHNYLPFIIEMLKILAQEKKLVSLVEQQKEKIKASKQTKPATVKT